MGWFLAALFFVLWYRSTLEIDRRDKEQELVNDLAQIKMHENE